MSDRVVRAPTRPTLLDSFASEAMSDPAKPEESPVFELHRCLVAAGRDQDAAAVGDAALRIEDSPATRNALR